MATLAHTTSWALILRPPRTRAGTGLSGSTKLTECFYALQSKSTSYQSLQNESNVAQNDGQIKGEFLCSIGLELLG